MLAGDPFAQLGDFAEVPQPESGPQEHDTGARLTRHPLQYLQTERAGSLQIHGHARAETQLRQVKARIHVRRELLQNAVRKVPRLRDTALRGQHAGLQHTRCRPPQEGRRQLLENPPRGPLATSLKVDLAKSHHRRQAVGSYLQDALELHLCLGPRTRSEVPHALAESGVGLVLRLLAADQDPQNAPHDGAASHGPDPFSRAKFWRAPECPGSSSRTLAKAALAPCRSSCCASTRASA